MDNNYVEREYADALLSDFYKKVEENKKLFNKYESVKDKIKNLIEVINIDKDNDYFICKENKELIDSLTKIIKN